MSIREVIKVDKITNFDFGGVIQYEPDLSRFEKVMRKLAFGHLAYMNDTLTFDSDFEVTMWFLQEMPPSRRAVFERPYTGLLLPEVGSRALARWAVAIIYEKDNSKQISPVGKMFKLAVTDIAFHQIATR